MAIPDVVKPPPGNPRFPLFDGLRAVAALSVVLTHVAGQIGTNYTWWGSWTARLDIGVTIFFLISGFLLYRPFVSARLNGTPRPGWAAFARRRALRILPAYWLALTVLAIWPGLGGVFTGDWWAYYGFLQAYRAKWSAFQGIVPAWSLCIEITFYALLPLFAAAMWRLPARSRDARVRWELWILGALALASIGFRIYLRATQPRAVLYHSLPATFDWFALGMGLAVISVWLHGRDRQPGVVQLIARRPWLPWLIAFGLFTFTAFGAGLPKTEPVHYTQLTWLAEHVLYGAVAFFVLLPAVFGDGAGGLPRRLLAHPVVAWLGLISYGIYLWHQPLVLEFRQLGLGDLIPGVPTVSLTLTAGGAAIACAAASYYLVERPLLRFKDGRPRPRPPRAEAEPLAPASELAGRAG